MVWCVCGMVCVCVCVCGMVSVYSSLCSDSHRATAVKVGVVVSMTLGGGSARGERWTECSEWERLSMHKSLCELKKKT